MTPRPCCLFINPICSPTTVRNGDILKCRPHCVVLVGHHENVGICVHIMHVTYLLTPWCRVLPEKLTGLKLVKKFPAFHGTRRFITALTSVRHLSISWASPIQSIYPYPTSWISILILSTHLRLGLPSGLFPSGFPTKTLYTCYFGKSKQEIGNAPQYTKNIN